MAVPRIPSPDPVTIPAALEKTYPDLIVTDIRLHNIPGQRASIGIGAHNYNYDTEEILDNGRPVAVHHIEGLAAETQRVPALDAVVREMVRVSLLLLRESILTKQIQELTRDINDLTGQMDDLAARIAALTEDQASEKAALEAQEAALRNRKTALQDQRAPLPGQLVEVRTQLGIE